MYLLLLALLFATSIALYSIVQLKALEKSHQQDISKIESALACIETLPNKLYGADGKKSGLNIIIEYPKIFTNQENYLGTIIPIIQEQNAQAYESLSNNLTLFSILIALLALALPIFSYAFLQKDQLLNINRQHNLLSKEAQRRFSELEKKREELEDDVQKAMDNLQKEIKQVQDVVSNVIPNQQNNESVNIEATSDNPEDRARALFYSARLNNNQRNYKEALKQIDEAIKLVPTNEDYFWLKSWILSDMREYKIALENDSAAIRAIPKNAKLYNSRAITCLYLKRYSDALDDARTAMELAPQNKTYVAEFTFALYKSKNYSEAIKRCLAFGEDIYKSSILLRTRAMAKLMQALKKNSKVNNKVREQVLRDLEQSLKMDSRNKYCYIYMAQAYNLLGEYSDMLNQLNKALLLDEDEPEIYHWLAEYYRAIGDDENAALNDRIANEKGYIPEPEEEE